MLQSSTGDTAVSAQFHVPSYQPEKLVHILLGDRDALVNDINHLVALGYCDRAAWSDPMPTGRCGEYISLMSRRVCHRTASV